MSKMSQYNMGNDIEKAKLDYLKKRTEKIKESLGPAWCPRMTEKEKTELEKYIELNNLPF